MRNLDTIETLETFVVLARLNSVGKTAEQLHISKASVSRRISSLETSIGKLFIRNQNGSEFDTFRLPFLRKDSTPPRAISQTFSPCLSTRREHQRINPNFSAQRYRQWFAHSMDHCIPKKKSRTFC